jgi:hypothetical protein
MIFHFKMDAKHNDQFSAKETERKKQNCRHLLIRVNIVRYSALMMIEAPRIPARVDNHGIGLISVEGSTWIRSFMVRGEKVNTT